MEDNPNSKGIAMTQEIINLVKKHCSDYKFENGDVFERYEFSKESKLIAEVAILTELVRILSDRVAKLEKK